VATNDRTVARKVFVPPGSPQESTEQFMEAWAAALSSSRPGSIPEPPDRATGESSKPDVWLRALAGHARLGSARAIWSGSRCHRQDRTHRRTRAEIPKEFPGLRRVRIPASRPHKPSRNPIPRNLTLDVSERFERF